MTKRLYVAYGVSQRLSAEAEPSEGRIEFQYSGTCIKERFAAVETPCIGANSVSLRLEPCRANYERILG